MRLRFVSQRVRLNPGRDDEALVMNRVARSGCEIPVLACTWFPEAAQCHGRGRRISSRVEKPARAQLEGPPGRAISIESTLLSVGDEPRMAPRPLRAVFADMRHSPELSSCRSLMEAA